MTTYYAEGICVGWPFCHVYSMATCIFECVLLDILVDHLREMHGKWPVHGHLLFCTLYVSILGW